MLIPQLDDRPFATHLVKEFSVAQKVDIATAWVRASGLRHIREALDGLLGRDGVLRVVVGLDADNSSVEGLRELVEVGNSAPDNVSLFVRHNEAYPVYHPKLYAARTDTRCRVLVGSNNLTGAGLFLNEEVSAMLEGDRGGELEASLDSYFATLTDLSSGLVKPLTSALIDELVQHGYVRPEASLPGKAANRSRRSKTTGAALFAYKAPKRRIPRLPTPVAAARIEPQTDEPVGDWQYVYLRLRLARGTQGQIPATVVRAIRARLRLPERDGPLDVTIAGTEGAQRISPAYTKRNAETPNTYKFEAFKPKGHALLRIDVIDSNVIVEKVDSGDAAGEIIEQFILDGLTTDPPKTFRKRRDDHATLWRFV